jgi:hypothetical protein
MKICLVTRRLVSCQDYITRCVRVLSSLLFILIRQLRHYYRCICRKTVISTAPHQLPNMLSTLPAPSSLQRVNKPRPLSMEEIKTLDSIFSSPPSPKPAEKKLGFLDLPPELRNQVSLSSAFPALPSTPTNYHHRSTSTSAPPRPPTSVSSPQPKT